MKLRLATIALVALIAPNAFAATIRARIEGPSPDGTTYIVRMEQARAGDTFESWGAAEGLVGEKRVTRLVRLHPATEPGVFTFTRTWPADGRWVLRFSPGRPPAPATVAPLDESGRVGTHLFFKNSDGIHESHRLLVPKGGPGDEDC